MKLIMWLIAFTSSGLLLAQDAKDLFQKSDQEIIWLGVDFSHVKLIGTFAQFFGAGEKGPEQIRDIYFPAWNKLILDERSKYDIKGMFRKEHIMYETNMITEINSKCDIENLETQNAPNYSLEEIQGFMENYNLPTNSGIGLLFIAESLSKSDEEACFHFVAIRNADKKILIHERLKGKPSGFGLRNYWAGSIYSIIKDIKGNRYQAWKSVYLGK
jgi:hypothetical protein